MKEDLIAIVQLAPVLWDKTHRHHNRHVLEKEWKKIATQLGMTDKQVRYVWKNLRQELGKQLKKTLKSGSAAPDEPSSNWPYFESMLFLIDQFIPRPSSENLAYNQDDSSSLIGSEDGEEERRYPEYTGRNYCSYFKSFCKWSFRKHHKCRRISKRKHRQDKTGYIKRVTPQTVIGQQLLELEKEKLKMKQNKAAENPNDDDVGFFNSLLPHVRQLTPRDKFRFRMQVQTILFDMAYPPQQSITASSIPYVAFSPQPSTSSGSTKHYLPYESGHEDAMTGITNADGGNYFNL